MTEGDRLADVIAEFVKAGDDDPTMRRQHYANGDGAAILARLARGDAATLRDAIQPRAIQNGDT